MGDREAVNIWKHTAGQGFFPFPRQTTMKEVLPQNIEEKRGLAMPVNFMGDRKAVDIHGIRCVIAVLLMLVFAHCSAAQAPIEPERLPSQTIFYVVWRGAPSPAARQANTLFALWDDPDVAPLRSALAENLFKDSGTNKTLGDRAAGNSKQAVTREEMEEYAALIENPFVLGYYAEPEGARARNVSLQKADRAAKWSGFYFVYDRTGKEALLTKAILRLRAQDKEPPRITAVTLAGIPVVKVESKTDTSYWAETGKYAVSAGEPRVFEEIVARLNPANAGPRGLADLAAFQESQSVVAKSSSLEFFARLPNLKDWQPDTKPGQPNLLPFFEALHLEAVHALRFGLSLDGPRTHLQGALLGNTSEGTLFDLWPAGDKALPLAALVPPDAVSYYEGRINLPGIYRVVRRAVRAFSPEGQPGILDMMEAGIQTRIGMPLPDALALFSGQIGSIQTAPDLDPAKQVYVLGIQKKPETLKLLRTLLSDKISSEKNEGDATFLKISTHGGESQAGTMQWGAYQLAVTPDLIVGAARGDTLRNVLAQRAQAGAASAFAAQPRYQAARAHYPQVLNGFSYYDFQRVDWEAAKSYWLTQFKKSAAESSNAKKDPQVPLWLERWNPQVISRHLHAASGASWKDSTGLKFDEWVE